MGSLLLVLKAMFSNSLQVLLQVAVWLIVLVAIWPTLSGCSHLSSEKPTVDTPHFTLWQLPSQTPSQMMSYVLVTGGGKVIVIDGGNRGDALYLKGFLGAVGNHVHNWFISHPHPDHVDALTAILEEPGDLKIDEIYSSLPEESWVANTTLAVGKRFWSEKRFWSLGNAYCEGLDAATKG